MKKKIFLYGSVCLACVDLLFELMYSTIGRTMASDDLMERNLNWIFMILRPEYLIMSGGVSCIGALWVIILLFDFKNKHSKATVILNILAFVLHGQYLFYYIKLLTMQ
jgi:hypothetical protein